VDDLLLKKYGGHVDQLSSKFWGMDRFRVRAMEKMIGTGSLEVHLHAATLRVLLYKLRILLNGARKRNNNQVTQECLQKIAMYEVAALKAVAP
jgi:hypothetical protein